MFQKLKRLPTYVSKNGGRDNDKGGRRTSCQSLSCVLLLQNYHYESYRYLSITIRTRQLYLYLRRVPFVLRSRL